MATMEELQEKAMKANERDPRNFGYGCFFGGSFVLDDVRVFTWHKDLEGLVEFLGTLAPAVYQVEEDDLTKYQAEVAPILESLRTKGIHDDVLEPINKSCASFMCIDWMGTFDELKSGDSEFAHGLRETFHEYNDEEDETDGDDAPSPTRPIEPDELDEFVEFVHTYGC